MLLRHAMPRWRLLGLILSAVLVVTGIHIVVLQQAPRTSAAPTAPVHTTPPDLSKGDADPRARLIGKPGDATQNSLELLVYEYTFNGQSTGIGVYPGVVFKNGKVIGNAQDWPATKAAGQDAQDFLDRTWADLDEIASNPEGVRLLKAMGEASPLRPAGGAGPRTFFNVNNPSSAPSVKSVITQAPPGDEYQAVKLGYDSASVSLDGSWPSEGSGCGASFIEVPDYIQGAYTEKGELFGIRSATSLFHELIHPFRSLLGFAPADSKMDRVYVENPVGDPSDPTEEWRVQTDAEELITHGGRSGLKAAFGSRRWTLGLMLNSDPYAAKAIRIATAAAKANPSDQAVAKTLDVRTSIGNNPISETTFVKASPITQLHRPTYNKPPNLPDRRFSLVMGVIWRALKQADYDSPEKSSSLMDRVAAGSACVAGTPLTGGDCGSSRRATAEEIKESADFKAAEREGKVAQESPESLIVRDLPADQLPVYAEARVKAAMAEYEAAPSGFSPGEFGFTSDLKVAMKNPAMIFQPFGGATSAKGVAPARLSKNLTKGWGAFNKAMTPAMAYMWINSITEAFSQDTSDLTKSAVVLAPVPVVGQLVGIADSVERKDGVGLAVNVLYLLAEASEFAGQPELAMILGVVALVTQIVAGIVDWVNGKSEVDKQIEGRDKAWHETMKTKVLEKSIPALLEAAQKAFDAAQKRLMFGAYATMAQLNATAERAGDSAVMEAARTANARTVANTKASVESLRSGFINGVHQAVTELFRSLNKGTGSDVFTKAYLDKSAFPAWYKGTWVPKQPKTCKTTGGFAPCGAPDERKGRAEWDKDVAPGVLANTPKDLFTSGDVKDAQDAVDSQLNEGKMFAPLSISDTTPVAPIGFIPCADKGGTCAGIEGRAGQVAFGAAGKYITTALPPGGIACKPSSFPTDPNPSAHESCFVPAEDNRSGGDGGSWLPSVGGCADEREKCTVAGTQEVAFGTGAHWIVKPVTSSVACDSSEEGFGADPAPGKAKECRVLAGSPPGHAGNAGGPYQACAVQGEHCHVTGKVRLAFGARISDEERGWIYKDVDGDAYPNGVPCTTSTFGKDPLPGEAEGCYLANPPAQFTYCSGPGGTCPVPESGTYQAAYGGNGSWVVKTVRSGNFACNDATFGEVAVVESGLKDAHKYCFLSAENHDLILGQETQHEVQSVGVDWASHACARENHDCKVDGPAGLAFGTYEIGHGTGTYLVKQFVPRADQTATNCGFSSFTPRDPQMNVPYCFLLTTPTLGFDTTQTNFTYRETKRTNPPVGPGPGPKKPDPDPHTDHGKAFGTGFEAADAKPTWTDSADNDRGGVDNVFGTKGGPGPVTSPRTGERAHTGTGSLMYAGSTRGGISNAHAYLKIFDLGNKPLSIGKAKTLSYWIYPKSADRWDNMDWPVNNSNCAAVDLVFTDGTTLRDSGAVDQMGNSVHPSDQCASLKPNEWNHITVNLGAKNSGKEISRINVGYDQDHPGNAEYSGYLDDIAIS